MAEQTLLLSNYIFDNIENVKRIYTHDDCVKLFGFIIQTIENDSSMTDEQKTHVLKDIYLKITNDSAQQQKIQQMEIEQQSIETKTIELHVIEIVNLQDEKFYLDKENNVYTLNESGHLISQGNIFENDKFLNQINTYTDDMTPVQTKNGTFYTDGQGKYFRKVSDTTYIRVK